MIENTLHQNEPRRQALQRDIDRFLAEGKEIEVLTPDPGDASANRRKPHYHGYFNTRES